MKTTCFLQVEPTFYNSGTLHEISVARVTQKRPRQPLPGSVVVKLTVDIADAAFMPLAPAAVVEIPVTHTTTILVESQPTEVPPVEGLS